MRQLTVYTVFSIESIDRKSEREEVKHLSTLRKINQFRDFPSSGERTGNSLNSAQAIALRVMGPQCETKNVRRTVWKVWQNRVTAPYSKTSMALEESRVPTDT